MARRIIAATFRENPSVASLIDDDFRKYSYVLSEEMLLLNTITVQELYSLFTKQRHNVNGHVTFEAFRETVEDIHDRAKKRHNYAFGPTLYNRCVRKLYDTLNVNKDDYLEPKDVCCGLSIFCRSEAHGGSGTGDDSLDVMEDLLFILCPNGMIGLNDMDRLLTRIFAALFTMSSALSEFARGTGFAGLAQTTTRMFFKVVSNSPSDSEVPTSIPVRHFVSWLSRVPLPNACSKKDAERVSMQVFGHGRRAPYATETDLRRTHESSAVLKQWLRDDCIDEESSRDYASTTASSPSSIATTPYALDGNGKDPKVKLAFDKYYGEAHYGKDRESHVVLGEIREESTPTKTVADASVPATEGRMELKVLRDRMYAVIRDFVKGAIAAPAFRSRMRMLNVKISPTAERLIRTAESTGRGSFVEFVKVFDQALPSNVYTEEQSQVVLRPADKAPPTPPFMSDSRCAGDVVAWRTARDGASRDVTTRHHRSSKTIQKKEEELSGHDKDHFLSWPERPSKRAGRSPDLARQSKISQPWNRDDGEYWQWSTGIRNRADPHANACPFGTEEDLKTRPKYRTGRKYAYDRSRAKVDSAGAVFESRATATGRVQSVHTGRRMLPDAAPQRTHLSYGSADPRPIASGSSTRAGRVGLALQDHVRIPAARPGSSSVPAGSSYAVRRDQRSHLRYASASPSQQVNSKPSSLPSVRRDLRSHLHHSSATP